MNIIGAFCDFYNMERFAKLHGKSEPWLTHAFATDEDFLADSIQAIALNFSRTEDARRGPNAASAASSQKTLAPEY